MTPNKSMNSPFCERPPAPHIKYKLRPPISAFKKLAPQRARTKTRWKYLCPPPAVCPGEGAARRQVGGPPGGKGLHAAESRVDFRKAKERAARGRSALRVCAWVMFFCCSCWGFSSDMRVVWCLVLLAAAAGVADAGLALHRRVQCGDHACSENEYCNTQFGHICSACSNVCDFSSHNYNHKDCYDNCQGNFQITIK